MPDRIFDFFAELLLTDKWAGKDEDSGILLERHSYQELQQEMMRLEREISSSLAREKHLKEAISRSDGEDRVTLKGQLKHQEIITSRLHQSQNRVMSNLTHWHSRIGALIEHERAEKAAARVFEFPIAADDESEGPPQQLEDEVLSFAE